MPVPAVLLILLIAFCAGYLKGYKDGKFWRNDL